MVEAVLQDQKPHAAGAAAMSAADLAELIGAFNDVTAKLQVTHESLRAEVSRLQGELAQANRQLERAQRLAALGEMAAGIAHEVRNPLGSIRLHARMLEQDLYDRPSERGVTRKILAAVDGLEAVVTDVMAFSKEFKVRPSACDASELMERSLNECLAVEQSRLSTSGERALAPLIVERTDLDAAPVRLECDEVLMHRALVNIIRNAIQAMTPEAHERDWRPEERQLRLEIRRERAAGAGGAARDMCVLSVSDTGRGVPAQVLERMFNPFFTTRAAGTGLGLAIVHRIVDAHRGVVRVRNKGGAEGTGAVIEVLLPVGSGVAGEEVESEGTPRGSDAAETGSGGGVGGGAQDHQPCTAGQLAGLTEQA